MITYYLRKDPNEVTTTPYEATVQLDRDAIREKKCININHQQLNCAGHVRVFQKSGKVFEEKTGLSWSEKDEWRRNNEGVSVLGNTDLLPQLVQKNIFFDA